MINLFQEYDAVLGRRSGLRRLALLFGISAILQGLTILTLVPVLRGLLDGPGGLPVGWFIVMTCCAVGSLAVFMGATRYSYEVCLQDLFTATTRIGRTVSRLPLGWFHGGTAARVNRAVLGDCDAMSHVPPILLPNIITGLLAPVTVFLGMLFLEWRMALVLLCSLPLLWLINRWGTRTADAATVTERRSDEEINREVLEFAKLQPVLRAAGGDRGLNRVNAAIRANNEAMRAKLSGTAPAMALFSFTAQIAMILALALGAHLMLGDRMDPPLFLALAVFCIRFAEPLGQVRAFLTALSDSRDAIRRIGEIVLAERLPEPAEDSRATPSDWGVSLRDVRFGYGDGPDVLDRVSLDFPEGTITALVGPSGCGKSTILRVIGRFHDVRDGAVTIGGADVRDIGTDALMDNTAMVFQDVYLFEGTVRENVLLGKPDATEAELAHAAQRSRLDDVIAHLPHGWDTEVGEGGGRLSGGERQRVSIARAFLKDAPILLLDEITSSLDGANEAAVTEAIRDLARGRTTILVAHRLSTVVHADKIVVLDAEGRVSDQGTHEELARRSGIYSRFLEDQAAGATWRLTGASEK